MAETINFTKANIDALPIPFQGRAEYIDAKQAGLRLRVTTTGIKSFCLLKRIRGAGMERITLGRYPEISIEQARKKPPRYWARSQKAIIQPKPSAPSRLNSLSPSYSSNTVNDMGRRNAPGKTISSDTETISRPPLATTK